MPPTHGSESQERGGSSFTLPHRRRNSVFCKVSAVAILAEWGVARYCCSRCSHCEEGTSLLLSSGGRPDSPPRFLWHHPSEEDQGISLSQGGGEVVTTDRGGWCLYIEMKVPASYLPQCHSIRGSKCLVTHCLARVEI